LSKFEIRIKNWLEKDPSFFERLDNLMFYYWYNKVPSSFRFFGLTHFLTKFSMIASAPALAFFVYKRIDATQATTAIVALFALFVVSSLLDQYSRNKSNAAELASVEAWVRIGDLITSVKSSATPEEKRDDTLIAALGVIEAYARQITKSPKGRVSVSLALYAGNGRTRMTIRHRNPGNERPTGRNLKHLERVHGHIACEAGPEPRVVSDLKSFGKEGFFSPTQSKCNYRSIIIIPITSRTTKQIKGFVSIDCVKPYAFHGAIAEQLIVTTEPLIDHIEEQF
jgi:hypothetical protein